MRVLPLLAYLVSITSLLRGGKVHLSRAKVAGILNVSERTIDRHLDDLEGAGILTRLVRDRSVGGWFFGTCLKWSLDIWDSLFVQPGRTRSEAISQKRGDTLATVIPLTLPTAVAKEPTQKPTETSTAAPLVASATENVPPVRGCKPKPSEFPADLNQSVASQSIPAKTASKSIGLRLSLKA
ncbi:HTH domain-containing protein [Rhodoferax sp.]|uniref:HTH domain-containing protein n=1 Tax=Rhodoferax sp. TaxID=50421 RepID=UPI00344A18D4